MSGVAECAEIRPELGVYVLGAIAPADRAMVDRHLASCPRCREEVAGLAGLPALLRRLPAAAVLSSENHTSPSPRPPGALADALPRRVAGLRRRREWRLEAAAAVLIAAAAAGCVPHLLRHAVQPRPAAVHWLAAVRGFDPATGAGATVRYTARAWGTELEASVTGIPAGSTCRIWVTDARGHDVAAGGWTILHGGAHTWYPASVQVPAASLHGFDITTHGKVLSAFGSAEACGQRSLTARRAIPRTPPLSR